MSAEALYHEIGKKLTDIELGRIESYYEVWQGQDLIPLKFRFIKVFGVNKHTRETNWFLLHKLVNKRRITNQQLPKILNEIIDDGIIPLRIFQSTTEWLAPNEVFTEKHHHPRLISGGFIPFENDESLETSLATACKLDSILRGEKVYIFSGNKSIHTWFFLEPLPLETGNAKDTETAEWKRRFSFYRTIQKQLPYEIDNRITADTRRVVPILNSLNAFTGRKVIQIDANQLCSLTVNDIYKISQLL